MKKFIVNFIIGSLLVALLAIPGAGRIHNKHCHVVYAFTVPITVVCPHGHQS